jgi:hypothetical protein
MVLLFCSSVLPSQGVSRFVAFNHDYQSYLPIVKFKNTSQHFIGCNPEMWDFKRRMNWEEFLQDTL